MIEEDKLTFCDYEVISELTTFISKHNSFEAEEGCNDDLYGLVIRAWLVAQDYFKELTDQDVRKRLAKNKRIRSSKIWHPSVSLSMDSMILLLWMMTETGGTLTNMET